MLITKHHVWTENYDFIKEVTGEFDSVHRINSRHLRVIVALLCILNDLRKELNPIDSIHHMRTGRIRSSEAEEAQREYVEKSDRLFTELVKWIEQTKFEVSVTVKHADIIVIHLFDDDAPEAHQRLRILIVRNSLMLHADVEPKGVRMFMGRAMGVNGGLQNALV